MSLFSKILQNKPENGVVDHLIQSTAYYRLIKSADGCIFKYYDKKTAKSVFEILKGIRHKNILNLTKDYKSQWLIPMDTFDEEISLVFREYIIMTVKNVLDFLHNKCNIVHGDLRPESLYLNEQTGDLIIGGFERAKKLSSTADAASFDCDWEKLDDLSVYFLQKPFDQANQTENFYVKFFEDLQMVPVMPLEDLAIFLNDFKKEQGANEMLEIVRMALAKFLIKKFTECSGNKNREVDEKEIKNAVKNERIFSSHLTCSYFYLYYLVSLNLKDYTVFMKEFVTIMDTRFRIEILKNLDQFLQVDVQWQEPCIFDALSIGLRCKDDRLQHLTLELVKNTISIYKRSQVKEIIKLLAYCKINLVISVIRDNFLLFHDADQKGLLKLFFILCEESEMQRDAMVLLKDNFKAFELKRLCNNLLPFLCEMICNSPYDELFDLIRAILDHLQSKKDELQSTEIKNRIKKWIPFLSKSNLSSDGVSSKKKSPKQQSPKKEKAMQEIQEDQWEDGW